MRILQALAPKHSIQCLMVDSREQKPLWSHTEKVRMSVGDYTTCLLQDSFVIERKSPGDLYGTITADHSRFRREIIRAKDEGKRMAVYVECSHNAFVTKKFPRGEYLKFPGETLAKIVATISLKYDLEFVWCRNRDDMKKKITLRFRHEEKLLVFSICHPVWR